ncbi:MAG: HD domain-containing protein [Armatimonadetes bacterium]|nr:HD domain-containing protein [Armatimonadota bacterium]
MSKPAPEQRPVTLKQVKANRKVHKLIEGANEVLDRMGYTEHGHRHAGIVSSITRYILNTLDSPERDQELGAIAAYLHDMGNVVNRLNHPMIGAVMSQQILTDMGMPIEEIIPIMGAIGNHEEHKGQPISRICAALIIADKSDVHFSRVQNSEYETFDIHDRVNFAVQKSRVEVRSDPPEIELTLQVDTEVASVMEYFEIFLSRMVMCRRSAQVLGHQFKLSVNGRHLA